MMDKGAFLQACDEIIRQGRTENGIGTLGEKTLHAVLKRYFEPYEDNHEIKLGNYVADIVGENGVIEIQTRGFDRLRAKLAELLEVTTVTVVHPIPAIKWVSWIDETTSEVTTRRKSPVKGTVYHSFYELYKIKPFIPHENFRLVIVLLEVEDYRNLNGWGKDKKRGSTRHERIPVDIIEQIEINCAADFARLIPDSLPEQFTNKDFAKATKLRLDGAQTATNVLRHIGVIEQVDKKGKTIIYGRSF